MLELEHGFRIVDVNARLVPDASTVAARGREVGPDRLEREFRQAGVVRAVVSPAVGADDGDDGYLRANNAVARLSVDRPFVAFARLAGPRTVDDRPAARLRNLTATRDTGHPGPDDVERYAYDDRFHGFALDPAADGLPDAATLSTLADVDLPVVVRAGRSFTPTAAAATVARAGAPVVLAGFGGYPLARELMHDAIDLLDDYDRLYVDTSAVRFREVLERGLLEHPDRVLFGSSTPDVHPDVAVMELLTLDVSADALKRAFDANPSRVVPALSAGAG
jgi:hypothetical protein